jgi:hypothetical protein
VGLKRFLLTGHWHTSLSLSTLSKVYQVAASLVHP